MTVTVSDHYVVGCPQCCAEVERITRAAVRDFSVTKLTFTPGHRHNHDEDKAEQPAAAVLEAAGQQTIPGALVQQSNAYVEGQ
jgi:hypothetical protein